MTIKKGNLPDIGNMNKRVELQLKSRVPDGGGGNEWTWNTFKTVWASVNGNVFYGNTNEHTETAHNLKFIIRYNSVIYNKPITSMKLVYNNRRFKILDMNNLNEANYYLEIICKGNDHEGI